MNSHDVKEKKLILWSGVSFFMILIVFVWFINIKNIFEEDLASNKNNNNIQWESISGEFNKTVVDIKTVLQEVKTATSGAENINE